MAKKNAKNVEVTNVEQVVDTEIKEVNKETKVVTNDMEVRVYNNTVAVLYVKNPRTAQDWMFNNYGDFDYMKVSDLIAIKSSYPAIINEGWLYIDDEDVVKYLGLQKLYDTLIPPYAIDDFLKQSSDEIIGAFRKANTNMKEVIIKNLNDKIEYIDSIKKKKEIEVALGITLGV